MGGRGTFAAGKSVAYTYETVDKIDGVKVLKPMDSTKSLKLPEESHSSSSYVLLDKDGVFHQYREYDDNHEVILEIGYHHEKSLGHGDILHIHVHQNPVSTITTTSLPRKENFIVPNMKNTKIFLKG